MELIDRERLIRDLKTSAMYHANNTHEETLMYRDRNIVREQPTVEAIPKADIQKALKENSKDISENVLAIVREEYISKADYENRLKADMVAMLKELKKEIDGIAIPKDASKSFQLGQASAFDLCEITIQQKIKTLRGEEHE